MASLPWRMKFGIFMAPFHRLGENPGLAMERDVSLLEWLDDLRFDEAWIGEHHSAGWELISSPEVFMAYAFARTRTIKLGTGVVSLPYHHPYQTAERMVLLDQLSRGRAMLGVGPGALPSDAHQFMLNPENQRAQMDEALGIIMQLLRGETVSYESDWIRLRDARIQVPSYTEPHLPVFVASVLSPSGPVVAGKHGAGVLSLSTFMPASLDLKQMWEKAEHAADEHGKTVDRRNWRLMLPIYVADTREEAYRDVSVGAYQFQKEYFDDTLGRAFEFDGNPEEFAQIMAMTGGAIIGTPDDAIEMVERLIDYSGGFGGLLGLCHEWAPTEKIRHSYELWARYVAPRFQGSLDPVVGSHDWASSQRQQLNKNEARSVLAAFNALGTAAPDAVYGVAATEASKDKG